jgi:hypothetical protein
MLSQSPPGPLARRSSAGRYVFPLLLVAVGIILLLNNLGVIPWTIWIALGQLWPVVLILLGVELLLGRRSAWLGTAIAAVVIVAAFVVALVLTFTQSPSGASAVLFQQQTANLPLAGATSGQVVLRFPAGILNVGAQPAGGADLVDATASLPPGMQLSQQAQLSGGVQKATLTVDGSSKTWPFGSPFGQNGLNLTAQLAPAVPLTLQADVGAGQSTFDLTNLVVREFTLNNGAGQVTIKFPTAAGQSTADIHSGAGQVTLEVPPGVGASIHYSGGLANVQIQSDRFPAVSGGYETADFASAQNRVDITLNVGVGEVDVR